MPTVIRRTISITPDQEQLALACAAERGFQHSFSAYIARLIVEDATKAGVKIKPAKSNKVAPKVAPTSATRS